MSVYFYRICSDLLEDESTSVVPPVLPNLDLFNVPMKILALFDCYRNDFNVSKFQLFFKKKYPILVFENGLTVYLIWNL